MSLNDEMLYFQQKKTLARNTELTQAQKNAVLEGMKSGMGYDPDGRKGPLADMPLSNGRPGSTLGKWNSQTREWEGY